MINASEEQMDVTITALNKTGIHTS